MRHRSIPLDDREAWETALRGIPHAFAHTWESCYAMHLTTGQATFLYCCDAGDVRVVCPIAERGGDGDVDIVTPYGFSGFAGSGEAPGFADAWRGFAQEQGYVCGYIGLNPLFERGGYSQPHETFRHHEIYVLDLSLSDEQLFRNLSDNRQRQLRRWDQAAAPVLLDRAALSTFFLAHYDDFVLRKQAAPIYRLSRETLSFLLDQPNVWMVGAGRAGRVEAVTVFGYTAHVADFLFNVSLPEGRQHSVSLLWYGVNHLKSLGVPTLNLGGGVRENDGLADFKQRFGGRALRLRAVKQVYRPGRYAELCRRAGADAADRSGYFPAYRDPTIGPKPTDEGEERQ